MGSRNMAIRPTSTITIDKTEAKIGRLMKKSENFTKLGVKFKVLRKELRDVGAFKIVMPLTSFEKGESPAEL